MPNPSTEPRRAALYARVSTKDRQEVDNQLRELRGFCERAGWEIVEEYIDHESGTVSERPEFQRLFLHAHQRRFDTVLFWALDRFSREGVRETLNYLNRLEGAGVAFKSFTEPYLDSLGPFRDAVIGLLASLAKQEVTRRAERVKAGLARAKAQGKRISRPALVDTVQREILRLAREGNLSQRAIARHLKLDPKTVRNYLKHAPR